MITGEIKNQIDNIWDTFWTGGITNSITILEQMTYLFFMKMLDDAQLKKESSAALLGVKVKDSVFEEGTWHNPETDKDVPYESLRWSVFKNYDATKMYNTIRNDVFPFIKNNLSQYQCPNMETVTFYRKAYYLPIRQRNERF